jgi:predicted alpha/beta superfamily hydrolase
MNGTMRELIVVGIEGTDRKRDFTYPSSDPVDRKEVPTHGGSAAFRQFLASELVPWVEARYRTSGETGIIGESLAGLFIVETLLETPELFDAYIAISPSLWWDRRSLIAAAPSRLRAKSLAGKRVYLSVANEGAAMGVDGLADALRAASPRGLDWRFEPLVTETHATVYHPAAMRALRLLFAPPPAPAPPREPAPPGP